MAIKVGINGFGRIGRMVFRAAVQNCPGFEIAGINDLLEPDYLAYMLQSDSVHGRCRGTVAVQGNMPIVNASLADGGDTLAAIARYGIADDTDCISTVGGAFLEVLEGKPPSAFEILARRAAQGIAA